MCRGVAISGERADTTKIGDADGSGVPARRNAVTRRGELDHMAELGQIAQRPGQRVGGAGKAGELGSRDGDVIRGGDGGDDGGDNGGDDGDGGGRW